MREHVHRPEKDILAAGPAGGSIAEGKLIMGIVEKAKDTAKDAVNRARSVVSGAAGPDEEPVEKARRAAGEADEEQAGPEDRAPARRK
ncbi:hypothetical protein SAMN05443377_11351 [Propionibacterium cyclohexanicum]|uniref:Uncharacterized protein n=1 Tax=Propionibacterium cyclohexanicum TaxID=64702 RepID=A0A1H9SH25_9ACTN|nr:hypothetical protein [Propionibacterium cyclohexanicum]SER84346.1 hypothetical protein SAMN05443377_11351 [Propionibacterium cyclohexanicum]